MAIWESTSRRGDWGDRWLTSCPRTSYPRALLPRDLVPVTFCSTTENFVRVWITVMDRVMVRVAGSKSVEKCCGVQCSGAGLREPVDTI